MTERLAEILQRAECGEFVARVELARRLREELRIVAGSIAPSAGEDRTLPTSRLVRETHLRLADSADEGGAFERRLLAPTARALRELFADCARSRHPIPPARTAVDPFELARALEELAEIDDGLARVAELRYLAGVKENEALAEALDLSSGATARRLLAAKAWLRERLLAG